MHHTYEKILFILDSNAAPLKSWGALQTISEQKEVFRDQAKAQMFQLIFQWLEILELKINKSLLLLLRIHGKDSLTLKVWQNIV